MSPIKLRSPCSESPDAALQFTGLRCFGEDEAVAANGRMVRTADLDLPRDAAQCHERSLPGGHAAAMATVATVRSGTIAAILWFMQSCRKYRLNS